MVHGEPPQFAGDDRDPDPPKIMRHFLGRITPGYLGVFLSDAVRSLALRASTPCLEHLIMTDWLK